MGFKKNFFVFLTALTFSGCATQAALVDVEQEITSLAAEQETLAKDIRELKSLQKTLEAMMEQSQSKSKGGNEEALGLIRKVTELETKLQNNSGLWEENNHLVSELSQKQETLSNKLNESAARIRAVETGLLSIEKEGRTTGSKENGSTAPPVESEEEMVVIPGRLPQNKMTSFEAYNIAYTDYIRGNYDMAIQEFETFLEHYGKSSLGHQAQFLIGESYYAKKDYQKAIAAYERLASGYPDSDKVVTAILKESYAFIEMGDTAKARDYLKKIIEKYPYSKEANLAKEKLSEVK